MATKTERFKAMQERTARPAKSKKRPKPRRDTAVDTAKPGVSATDRKARRSARGSTSESARAGRKGGAALEGSESGKPSRKSTRKSAGRIKRTANLQRKVTRAVSSPKARASRQK
jgi:hypothetical protein